MRNLYIDSDFDKEHREKTASFYTPIAIAKKMVMEALDRRLAVDLDLRDLTTLSMMDISCGSGVFIIVYIECLLHYYDHDPRFQLMERSLFIQKTVTQIYGTDINAEALEHLKVILSEKYKIYDFHHFYEMNALTDEFMDKIDKRDFDFIFGNPPYLGEKSNKEAFDAIKGSTLYRDHYQAKMDYFYFFIYRSVSCVRENPLGQVCFLVSNYFVTADGASQLRGFLKDHVEIKSITDYGAINLFKEAKGHHSLTIHLTNKGTYGATKMKLDLCKGTKDKTLLFEKYECDSQDIFDKNNNMILSNPLETILYKKICRMTPHTIHDFFNVNQGVVSGADYAFVTDRATIHREGIEEDIIKPFYKNSDIRRNSVVTKDDENPKFLLYVDGRDLNFEEKHPHTIAYLMPYKNRLSLRRECLAGIRPWYALQWPRDEGIFTSHKIITPHRSTTNRFAYHEGAFYASADVYYLTRKEVLDPILWKGYARLLNSGFYHFLLSVGGKRKGQILEIYATPLKMLPFPSIEDPAFHKIGSMDEEEAEKWIMTWLADIYGLSKEEMMLVEKRGYHG